MALRKTRERITGGTIDVSYAGDTTAEPILFLHGGGTYPPRYCASLERLAQNYYLIAPHLRAASLRDQANIAGDIAAALIGDAYHVIGHSYGAAAALTLAASRTGPSDLIYVNGPLEGPRQLRQLLRGSREIAHKVSARLPRNKIPQHLFMRTWEFIQYLRLQSHHGREFLNDVRRFTPNEIACPIPTLFLHTAHDEFFPLTVTAHNTISTTHPSAQFRIINNQDLTHTWFYDHPERVWTEVHRFYTQGTTQQTRCFKHKG